jgi:adenylate cyclase
VKHRVWPLLAGVALLAPALAILTSETRVGRTLERRAYDGWFTLRGALPRSSDVVLVAIDTDSEQSLGRYPWRRTWHAALIRNLTRAGARVIAFDATFADAFPQDDSILRAAIDQSGKVVLGAKTGVLFQRGARGYRLEEPAGALRGAPIGIVDIRTDPLDGVIREYPVLQEYPQGIVPQLGVHAILRFLDLPASALTSTEDGWRAGDRFIPRGPGGGMLIDFSGMAGSVATYSYASVIDDAQTDIGEWDLDTFEDLEREGRFKDKIVIVGTTVPEHQDLHATPFRDAEGGSGAILMPGVEIHAQAVAAILERRHIEPLPRTIQYAWTILLAVLIVAAPSWLRGVRGAIFAALAVACAVALSWYLFTHHHMWLWTVAPVLSVGLSYAGSTAVLFVVEEKEKARIRGMFQQYVAVDVVNELMRRPELLALGGEERVATMLFSDVESFSSVAEKLGPTGLVALLNEYLTAMTDIIVANGGIIDKYQGDAVMAEFGVPVPLPDHALRACMAALQMQEELARLREKWKQEGKPELRARVGINTGMVLVGNLGSKRIMDYTVMGDHVNLASRLEGTNKAYGTPILISEFTWAEVKDHIIAREIDRVRVVGRVEPVAIYELIGTRSQGIDAATERLIEEFADALALCRARQFVEAQAAFDRIAERHPEDGPTGFYVERCCEYCVNPPPADWDGVYQITSK